ncbi:UDP-N-acetyl-D-mannosamine dehydrogenase [Alcanivorax sp. S71-1-4]|uniref:UDP-N-acetyl-D-mannosamine dehydrogenase n=1 Tax=Alcanivorax sp. S71-1-4 TaxID=1177159 RepID=UPI001358FDC7|nr:UDP-N-acetyl-D-mannosamine dehydrogenase [Alcanivorax sp. S71-1-4]KAF0809830.1 UDP-N-acetyl-D-mannosamine dehydrogenase [Alcanivorax sp. S71-1-4]
MKFENICVVGLGYIGLPTATMFASRRKHVVGVDINQHAVDTISRGEIHIVEPDLDIAVHAAVKGGYLRATTVPEKADAFLIAVPTPFRKDDADTCDGVPTPDLSYIQAAVRSIAPVLEKGNLIILESTSPVGATERMAAWLADERPDLTFPQQVGDQADILIAHCPERVLPGRVMLELIDNDRIIGGMTPRCATAACQLYKEFVRGACLLTDARTAEMAKLTENAFRDVNIAFANELSMICEAEGINVWELIELANRHPRVNILQPGPGVGGHCIAVDPWFIVSRNPDTARLISTARRVNDLKPGWVLGKIVEELSALDGSDRRKKVGFYGLAFKADIDDTRESPAVKIVQEAARLLSADILVMDPYVKELPASLIPVCDLVEFEKVRGELDLLVVLVDHKPIKAWASDNLPGIPVIDTRGVWK